MRVVCVLSVAVGLCSLAWHDPVTAQVTEPSAATEWRTYGHDAGANRYSPLTQINTQNVAQLQVAWTYHMRPANAPAAQPDPIPAEVAQRIAEGAVPLRRRAAGRFSGSETTPLVVNGVMYLSTPYRRVVAVDAETGIEKWAYEVGGTGQPSLRGVEYWSGDGVTAPRIVFGTRDGRLIALDALTGQPAAGFGEQGIVNLRTAEIMGKANPQASYGMTSPPLVVGNVVVTGAAVQENPALGAAGDVRGWDMRTGKLLWTFHTVPRKGEFGNHTWAGNSWQDRSGTNAWGLMSADVERGLVYFSLGAPTWDRYGGDRVGDNLFSTSVVAVDVRTGKRAWHFQIVHHDIWDMDAEAAPVLFDLQKEGKTIPAMGVVSKSGYFFLLNRVTGKPLIPVVERPVPTSDVPNEVTSLTQPMPLKPAPFARQSFFMSDVATVTPELEAFCRNFIESNKMRMGGPYLPLGYKTPTIGFPGRQGGANWGGGSYDPLSGLFFVNANNLGQVEEITPRADGSLSTGGATSGRFSDRDKGLMCQQPPWGTLTAIDVNKGEIVWQSTLGVTDSLPAGVNKTGRPNVGGSIVTAGGLVFIGATDDARFRAFDARTGAEVWTYKLDASAHATPITYATRNGRQMVAVVGTGGSFLDSPINSDAVTVFALPENK